MLALALALVSAWEEVWAAAVEETVDELFSGLIGIVDGKDGEEEAVDWEVEDVEDLEADAWEVLGDVGDGLADGGLAEVDEAADGGH